MADDTPPPPKRKLKHSTRAKDELSAEEEAFCQHYAKSKNGVEAYKAAGFRNSKAAYHTVGFAAGWLLKKSQIRLRIRNIRAAAVAAAQVTVDDMARGFRDMATADRTAVFAPDGVTLRPFAEWPEILRQIVTEFTPVQDAEGKVTGYKVKFEKTMEARKILAQWRGMIGDGKEKDKGGSDKPMVVGGEADPDKV